MCETQQVFKTHCSYKMQSKAPDQKQPDSPSIYQLLVSDITQIVLEKIKQEYFSNSLKGNNTDLKIEVLNLTNPPIGRVTLYNWTLARKVKAYKVGSRNYYSKKAMIAFLTSTEKKPPQRHLI